MLCDTELLTAGGSAIVVARRSRELERECTSWGVVDNMMDVFLIVLDFSKAKIALVKTVEKGGAR